MTIAHRSTSPRLTRRRSTLLLAVCLVACGGSDARPDTVAVASGRAATAPSPRAASDTSCPLTGAWRECSVTDRLERAGAAPRRIPGTMRRPGFGEPGIRFAIGDATLEVFLYASAADRVRAVAALDSATAAPPGKPIDWPKPPTLMASGNLAAVLYGAREREVERIALALTAGLPER